VKENIVHLKCSFCWVNTTIEHLQNREHEVFPARGLAKCLTCGKFQKIKTTADN
jgi:uncharacterized Zn finger protein